MPTITNDSYSVGTGVTVYAGRVASTVMPMWLSAATVGAWTAIAGTVSTSYLAAYSGAAWRETGGVVEVASLCSGGHTDNPTENSVRTLRLDVDAPAWVTRLPASDATGFDSNGTMAYFPSDGRPAPRHTYWYNWWSPELGRYVMTTARFVGLLTYDYANFDGFNPATNTWDVAGTYAASQGRIVVRDPVTGYMYSHETNTLKRYVPATQTWSTTGNITGASVNRGGSAFDTLRGKIYHLSVGDNWTGGNSTPVSATVNVTTAVATAITFNASAAYTQFLADGPSSLGTQIVYDADTDRFYFYAGQVSLRGRVYVITPNSGTVWDMSILPVTGVTPPDVGGAGVLTKIAYISQFKSLVLIAPSANAHFVRIS